MIRGRGSLPTAARVAPPVEDFMADVQPEDDDLDVEFEPARIDLKPLEP